MSVSELPSPAELAGTSKLFALLDEQGRARLLGGASRRGLAAGEVVCREGEKGEEFFVVLSGKVEVTADDFGAAKSIASMGRGGFFGEMAVLTSQPRSATVVAAEPTELLVFARATVDEVLRDYPTAREALGRVGVMRTEQLMEKLSGG